MANRARDWFAQSEHDPEHAPAAAEAERFDWVCCAAQQAPAESARR